MGGARKVLIGITGGIAAYKIPLLVRILRKNGCEVKTVLTDAAKTLVGADALRTLSGNPVYTDGAGGGQGQYDMDHIRLSEWSDVFVICPATANTIAKMSCGIADNLLTTLALSIDAARIIVAPAMNCVMWSNGATQANVDTLKGRGVTVLPVEDGELACGVSGPGRMLEVEEIFEYVMVKLNSMTETSKETTPSAARPPLQGGELNTSSALRSPRDLSYNLLEGKNILISSGPTEEPIDPVRVITNKSSGKMGAALAKAAMDLGAKVTVVSGPAAVPLPSGAEVVNVRTAAEMEREMACRFGASDICIMAAAVSDYRPVNPSDTKIRKNGSGDITLSLTPNPDILAGLGASKKDGQFLIGFSLEDTDADVVKAAEKMKRKNCDMMVFNKASRSLGGDDTAVTLLFADGTSKNYPATDKLTAAAAILTAAASKISGGGR